MSDKRSDYISWDEYFMGVAALAGMRSKDPNTQVGACIVSPDNKILSMGYQKGEFAQAKLVAAPMTNSPGSVNRRTIMSLRPSIRTLFTVN